MLSLHVYLPAPPPLLLQGADICRDANGEWQPKAGLSASDLKKFNEAKTKYNDLQKNFGANSPARIIATALTGAAGGNVAGNLTGLVQGVAVNVLQSLAVNQVKHIADSLYDANGNPTAGSETVRAALQGLTACAGGAANGTGSCSSAGASASASVVINYLLTEFLDPHPKDAQGNPIERTLEDQQARTNLVTTLIGAIAAGAGLDAGSATTAAQIETENNQNAPGTKGFGDAEFNNECGKPGMRPCNGLQYADYRDAKAGVTRLPDGRVLTEEEAAFYREQYALASSAVYASLNKYFSGDMNTAILPTDAQILIALEATIGGGLQPGNLENFIDSFGGVSRLQDRINTGVSAKDLAQKYIGFEKLKAVAFNQVSLGDINRYGTDPKAFEDLAKTDPQKATLVQLAIAYVNENTASAVFNGGGSFADRVKLANDQYEVTTRALGLVQGVFSGLGAVGAGSAAVTTGAACPATLGAGCVASAGLGILAAIEADQSLAGFTTFFTGQSTNSMLAKGASALVGIDADKADLVIGISAGIGGLASGGAVLANGADDAIDNIDLGGELASNLATVSDEALAAARVKQITFNQIAGSEFEQSVLAALGHVGATKNTIKSATVLADGTIANTIVDATGREVGGFLEIKNVLDLSLTKQLEAMIKAASDAKMPFNLVVSPRTRDISQNLQKAIEATGGSIQVFDPVTGTMVPFGG